MRFKCCFFVSVSRNVPFGVKCAFCIRGVQVSAAFITLRVVDRVINARRERFEAILPSTCRDMSRIRLVCNGSIRPRKSNCEQVFSRCFSWRSLLSVLLFIRKKILSPVRKSAQPSSRSDFLDTIGDRHRSDPKIRACFPTLSYANDKLSEESTSFCYLDREISLDLENCPVSSSFPRDVPLVWRIFREDRYRRVEKRGWPASRNAMHPPSPRRGHLLFVPPSLVFAEPRKF